MGYGFCKILIYLINKNIKKKKQLLNMKPLERTIFFIFFLSICNISHSIEKAVVCTLDDKRLPDRKMEVNLDTTTKIVKTREFGKSKWNQRQDFIVKNNGYIWASPAPDLSSINIMALTKDLKSLFLDAYNITLNRKDFSRWLLMNNYTLDDVEKQPDLPTKYIFTLINENNKIKNLSFNWSCLILK